MTSTTVALIDGEVEILIDLLGQVIELFGEPDGDDPAIARLSPSAYRDNDEASAEFRRLTQTDLLTQRADDANVMLAALTTSAGSVAEHSPTDDSVNASVSDDGNLILTLTDSEVLSWMRTLAALRLIMATRLGIDGDDRHDQDDPKFALYDWLAYRLEMLVEASEA